MAQVRKYSTGGETSPKLLKREGYGDYNVADIESQYAKSLNGILDEMGLEDEAETIWDAMAPARQFEY